MDPLTLFALANGAVSAVKAGCKLYKDIKSAAGDVKDVLKDMDAQFSKLHPPEKPATVEQRNNFVKQRNEVVVLNKKANSGEHTSIYSEIGEHLGTEVEEMMKVMGKEQQVLLTKQLQQQAIIDKRRALRMRKLRDEFATGVAIIVIIFVMGGVFMWVAYDRQRKYPQYGDGIFPKSEEQRREEAEPKKYIGR
jgi:hypothetical protein